MGKKREKHRREGGRVIINPKNYTPDYISPGILKIAAVWVQGEKKVAGDD